MLTCEQCGSARVDADRVQDVVTCLYRFGVACKDCGFIATPGLTADLLDALPVRMVVVTAWGSQLVHQGNGWWSSTVSPTAGKATLWRSATVVRDFELAGPIEPRKGFGT